MAVLPCCSVGAVRDVQQRRQVSECFPQRIRCATDDAIFSGREAQVADLGIEREEAIGVEVARGDFLAKSRVLFC